MKREMKPETKAQREATRARQTVVSLRRRAVKLTKDLKDTDEALTKALADMKERKQTADNYFDEEKEYLDTTQ